MQDKRKHQRQSLKCVVRYLTEDCPDRPVTTKAVDISLGGIGLYMREFIKSNMSIKLQIYSQLSTVPIDVEGKVVWQSGYPGFGAHRAGIQFTDAPYTRIKSLVNEAAG